MGLMERWNHLVWDTKQNLGVVVSGGVGGVWSQLDWDTKQNLRGMGLGATMG